MNITKAILGKTLVASPERQHEADSDWVVVQRVQAGDVAAFDDLIRKYRERLYAIIYNMIGNREDAADLAQDTFIKAFQSIKRFSGESAFFTWLYRIGVNAALGHLRKHRLRQFFSLDKVDEDNQPAAEVIAALTVDLTADRDTYVKELQEKLNEALQKLSIKHR
ncbi:MAG TPA: sigma-70 family RNA polymerase sigma factor, partial [Opitutaceae bacterium]|nr:sigma-70 family RNA polymerase sigma factor [Opitutaceae bacterium]HQL20929.1 sigma-70 family RNA polymerase sigma factor [Opitutaceae bacterium]